jgi:hypothetical protein
MPAADQVAYVLDTVAVRIEEGVAVLKKLSLLVLGLVSCASLAACSSSGGTAAPDTSPMVTAPGSPSPLSAAAYKNVLKKIAAQENRAQHAVQGAFHASTAAAVREALSAFAADQQHVADELHRTVSPADARAANSALAQAFADNAAATRQLVRSLAHVPSAKAALHVIQAASGPQRSGREIDAALAQLRKLGYAEGS